MTQNILLLNGPNLNLLGKREPDIYGHDTLADVEEQCRALLPAGFALEMKQSNHEGELVDWIQAARTEAAAIVINPGAYSHTSIAILDALHAFAGPVMEVHVSNIHKRENFRHHSYVSLRADGIVVGFGVAGYSAAVRQVVSLLSADQLAAIVSTTRYWHHRHPPHPPPGCTLRPAWVAGARTLRRADHGRTEGQISRPDRHGCR